MDFQTRYGKNITQCELVMGYTFSNKPLCAEALNNAGDSTAIYDDHGKLRRLPKNDRLAVYGDSIAPPVLCRRWYLTGSEKESWTSMRNNALCNNSLAKLGVSLGLDECVFKDAGTPNVSKKMMCTAMEALLGAVHLDGGDRALITVMEDLCIIDRPDSPISEDHPESLIDF